MALSQVQQRLYNVQFKNQLSEMTTNSNRIIPRLAGKQTPKPHVIALILHYIKS